MSTPSLGSDAVKLVEEEGAIGWVNHIIEVLKNEDAGSQEPRFRKDLLHRSLFTSPSCRVVSLDNAYKDLKHLSYS